MRRFSELSKQLALEYVGGPDDPFIAAVTADSRGVVPQGCFVAVRGRGVDGHGFCEEAIRRGAQVLIVEDESRCPPRNGFTVFKASDTREVLAELLRQWYGTPDQRLRLVAVTGTNGKTSVCHFVRDLLEAEGVACGLLGTIQIDTGRRRENSRLTTPGPEELFSLLAEMVGSNRRACAMEASSHSLDQRRLGRAEIDVAAFTNVGRDHLDYHPDLQHYVDSKRRLLDLVDQPQRRKARGRVVVNADDPTWARLDWPSDTLFVGSSKHCEVRIRDVRIARRGTALSLEIEGRIREFEAPVLGRYNGENLAMAAGVARALGMDAEQIASRFSKLRPVSGRLEPVALADGPLCLVDYAHTPEGLRAALLACRELSAGRLFVVFGCGGDRDRGKRPLMAAVALEHADRVYLTLDNPRTEDPERIFADTRRGFAVAPDRALTIPDRAEAIERALQDCRSEDVLLIAGKGHERYQIIGTERVEWDDREVARRSWAQPREGRA